ncbi:hypothetical protein HK099_007623 [Clydaea vesicula]|uniref:ELYS-like domain-containing protein n=1 Tax=Clydaea vesicula TaxID=447962 RepID=A0AAD5TX10_9FUNG|nr:hypothetical protein HK099_007623 [Clydaea vesicula]
MIVNSVNFFAIYTDTEMKVYSRLNNEQVSTFKIDKINDGLLLSKVTALKDDFLILSIINLIGDNVVLKIFNTLNKTAFDLVNDPFQFQTCELATNWDYSSPFTFLVTREKKMLYLNCIDSNFKLGPKRIELKKIESLNDVQVIKSYKISNKKKNYGNFFFFGDANGNFEIFEFFFNNTNFLNIDFQFSVKKIFESNFGLKGGITDIEFHQYDVSVEILNGLLCITHRYQNRDVVSFVILKDLEYNVIYNDFGNLEYPFLITSCTLIKNFTVEREIIFYSLWKNKYNSFQLIVSRFEKNNNIQIIFEYFFQHDVNILEMELWRNGRKITLVDLNGVILEVDNLVNVEYNVTEVISDIPKFDMLFLNDPSIYYETFALNKLEKKKSLGVDFQYPPTKIDQFELLFDKIWSSDAELLQKQCFTWYLIKDYYFNAPSDNFIKDENFLRNSGDTEFDIIADQPENSFAESNLIPHNIQLELSGYWNFDQSNFEECLEDFISSGIQLEEIFKKKVLKTFFIKKKFKLVIKYLNYFEKNNLSEEFDNDQFLLKLESYLMVDFYDGVSYMRKCRNFYSNIPILEYFFYFVIITIENPKIKYLKKNFLNFPFTKEEVEKLIEFCSADTNNKFKLEDSRLSEKDDLTTSIQLKKLFFLFLYYLNKNEYRKSLSISMTLKRLISEIIKKNGNYKFSLIQNNEFSNITEILKYFITGVNIEVEAESNEVENLLEIQMAENNDVKKVHIDDKINDVEHKSLATTSPSFKEVKSSNESPNSRISLFKTEELPAPIKLPINSNIARVCESKEKKKTGLNDNENENESIVRVSRLKNTSPFSPRKKTSDANNTKKNFETELTSPLANETKLNNFDDAKSSGILTRSQIQRNADNLASKKKIDFNLTSSTASNTISTNTKMRKAKNPFLDTPAVGTSITTGSGRILRNTPARSKKNFLNDFNKKVFENNAVDVKKTLEKKRKRVVKLKDLPSNDDGINDLDELDLEEFDDTPLKGKKPVGTLKRTVVTRGMAASKNIKKT